VRCFYFDSIGVPTAEVMERDHGGSEKWQATATTEWLARLSGLSEDIRVAVLDGQTRPSFVFSAAARVATRAAPRRTHWAAYLRGQADALGLAVIDTSLLTITEAAEQLEQIVTRLMESHAPAA
jgi:hypothetical protein